MTDDARTLDFLENSGPLAVDWKAPDLTPEQMLRAAAGRASFELNQQRATAAATSVRNIPYSSIRAAEDRNTIAASNYVSRLPIMHQGEGPWNFAGMDLGLLPVAVAVVVPLIATAATGGLAAPSVAASWKQLKGTVHDAQHMNSIGDIQGVVGEVKAQAQAFKVPDLIADEMVAAHVVADQILGNGSVNDAHAIIANTQALALAGDPDAQRGAVILAKVAGARKTAGTPFGQPLMPVHTAQQAALVAGTVPKTIYSLTAQDVLKVTDVRRGWWKRLIHWLEGVL